MNTKKLWIAALTAAVVTTAVSNLPLLEFVNCLLFAGFWGSAIFGVWLYRRLTGSVTLKQAVMIGALTGLCAGIMGFTLSFVNLAGAQGMLTRLSLVLPPESMQNAQDIPASSILGFNLVGVLFNVIFGTMGGWIGGAILHTDHRAHMAPAAL
jgi:hypothetical protein